MAQAMKIAIVDDEQDMRQSISQWLALSGYDTETFASAEDALKNLGPDYPGIVISDIKMPGMDGMELQKKLNEKHSILPIIFVTGHGDVPMAVDGTPGELEVLMRGQPFGRYREGRADLAMQRRDTHRADVTALRSADLDFRAESGGGSTQRLRRAEKNNDG